MALIKLGGLITQISGKIGGQSISNLGNYASIKNITQRNKIPTLAQSKQRFITSAISNSWQNLTQAQRDNWQVAAQDYTWLNNIFEIVTRNGYQTYCFLNQNLTVIGIANISNAPLYVPVTMPKINIIDISSGVFEIQSNNASSDYLYALFGVANLTFGSSATKGQLKFIGVVTAAQLNAGYDVVPNLEVVYGLLVFPNKMAVTVDPINQTTGNRNQFTTIIENVDKPMVLQVTVSDGATVTIPFLSGGTYDGSINFGDGSTFTFNTWNDPNLTHTYTIGGVYNITIFGAFNNFRVNNGAFKNYLTDIIQFGSNTFGHLEFYGCNQLVNVNCSDTPTFRAGSSIQLLFRSCTNLLSFKNLESWDTSLLGGAWLSFTACPISVDLSNWDTSLFTILASCFNNAPNVTGYSNWSVSLVTDLSNTFFNNSNVEDCSNWNISAALVNLQQTFSGSNANFSIASWVTTNVSNWNQTFRNVQYNNDLSSNNFSSATNMTLFFQGNNAFTTAFYDALLQKIVADGPQNNVTAGFTNATYTIGGAGEMARDTLINTFGWTITDGGGV